MIDSDDKLRRDMKRFILEMDDTHNVREFESYDAFDKRYLQIKGVNTNNIKDHEWAKNLEDPQAQWLQEQTLSKNSPFSPNPLVLELSRKDFSITSMDRVPEGNILGLDAEKIVSASDDFNALIPAPFKNDWEKFLESLKELGKATILIPFKSEDGIWILNIKGTIEGDHFKVEIYDAKKEMGVFFGNATQATKDDSDSENSLQLLGTVHCIICRKDSIQTKDYSKWARELKLKLKKAQFFPPDNETRLIVTKYDDDGTDKGKLLCNEIEDLVSLPLDRPVFMQKLEFVLALPNRVTPSYLFTQPLDEKVAISKKSYIDRINDLCISILNPTPLKPGVPAVLYIRLNVGEPLIKIYCKAVNSEPHSELANFYRVTLAYFGLDKKALLYIKKYLGDKNYKQLTNTNPEDFQFNPHNLFLTDAEKEKKNIIIIEPDFHEASRIKDSIENEIDNVRVFIEPSYNDFMHNYLSGNLKQKVYAPIATSKDVFDSKAELLINAMSFTLIQPLSSFKKTDKFLGHSAAELFGNPDKWQALFIHEETGNILKNKIESLEGSGDRSHFFAELTNFNGDLKTMQVELIKESAPTDVKMIISLAPIGSVNTSERVAIDKIDIVLIDALFLPDALNEWHNGLSNLIKKYYPKQKVPVSVIALKDPKTNINFDSYLNSPIHSIYGKNSESKRLFFALASTGKILFTQYLVTNLGWYETKQPVYIAKPVKLAQIGEYGCAIVLPRPLKPGTPLYLHEFIFDNAPDGNMCAKVMHSEQHESKELGYVCYLNYFGINDAFLKYTRNWIRESYAQQKEAKSN